MKGKHRTVIMTVISMIFLLPSLYGAHLDMMLGNDNKTFGLGRNLDDGRSFGSVTQPATASALPASRQAAVRGSRTR